MKVISSLVALTLLLLTFPTNAAPPVVSNIRAGQRVGTHLVDIYYNVSDPDGSGPLTIYVAISANAGLNYNVPVFTLTGAVGPGVTPGNDRLITWNAGTDWPGQFNNQCRVRITADDGTAPPAPLNMAYIPGGVFQMGDNFLEGGNAEIPVHTVFVSPFFMDKNLVSRELWLEVYSWAIANGYDFNFSGSFKAANHPVQTIYWYDAVKWCNARSQKEGLTPCYYTDSTQTTIYKTGSLDITNACVKWTANGYRLPTEAEWEKAARGGSNGRRFPWGDTITHSQANYYSQSTFAYDISPTRGEHPTYATGSSPYTSPIGSFAANAYGLFDMAGNVSEWCWDFYEDHWYGQPSSTTDDGRGPPIALSNRVLRGSSCYDVAYYARVGARYGRLPNTASFILGFRCARGF